MTVGHKKQWFLGCDIQSIAIFLKDTLDFIKVKSFVLQCEKTAYNGRRYLQITYLIRTVKDLYNSIIKDK